MIAVALGRSSVPHSGHVERIEGVLDDRYAVIENERGVHDMTVDEQGRTEQQNRAPRSVSLAVRHNEPSSPASAGGESFCSRSDIRSVVKKLANPENETRARCPTL